MKHKSKPDYKIPSMEEIKAIPWNGFNVVSTFSGTGGSCLGYRIAGYRVLWANEFIKAAQDCYKLNHPNSILDTRDIRNIKAEEILKVIKFKQGEIDIFDGSPPCASFSTAGKREKGWGQVKQYSNTKQRTDDLFYEYARLLKGLKPKVFVAENVSGLIKGTAKGYFIDILKTLKKCGYQVKCKVLDAQWLGVPQARQRTIFIGVREDLKLIPIYPTPFKYRYTIGEILPFIISVETSNGFNKHAMQSIQNKSFPTIQQSRPVNVECDISKYAIGKEWDKLKPGEKSDKYFQLTKPSLNKPCPTITQRGGDVTTASVIHPLEKRKFTIEELKLICAFPADFKLTGSYAQQWERLGRAVPPLMMKAIASTIQTKILEKIK